MAEAPTPSPAASNATLQADLQRSAPRHPPHPAALAFEAAAADKSPAERRAYHLTVAYDGTDFVGWQKQEPPDEAPLRSVQGTLEEVLRNFFNDPELRLTGASRTDSGVHAVGQSCVFETATRVPVERMALAITSRCPQDLVVTAARAAPPDFDVIGGVTSKQYRYRLGFGPERPLFSRRYVHHVYCPLDAARMQDAAARFVGEVNLAGFAAAGHGRTTTVRTIHDCHIETPAGYPNEVHVVVSSNGFLLNTVRIIAGTLLEVGRGHFEPQQVTTALQSGNRRDAGPTLPPTGLCLEWVKYGQG